MEKVIEIFNCYECKYYDVVLGSVHSCCYYPGTKTGIDENLIMRKELNIKSNAYAIRSDGIHSGWFMRPVNFDPIWLENCDGFEKKDKKIKEN